MADKKVQERPIARVLNRMLAEPSGRVSTDEMRRKSRLLSWVLLTVVVFGTAMYVGDVRYRSAVHIGWDPDVLVTAAALAVLLVCYALNRLGFFVVAAVSSVVVMSSAIFAAAVPTPSYGDVGMLYFLIIPILFSSLTLSFAFTAVLTGAAIAGTVLFAVLVPDVPPEEVPVLTTVVVGGLVLFASKYRARVEADRTRRLRFLATHDRLTGLVNRSIFEDRLELAIARSQRTTHRFAVMFLDLDNFKQINDAFGHQFGDHLLVEVADRMRATLRETDTIARFGGDEFGILVESLTSDVSITAIARKLLDAVAQPYTIDDREIVVTAGVGVTIGPFESGSTAEAVLQRTDVALGHVKAENQNDFAIYRKAMSNITAERLALAADLRHALSRDEFFLVFQPQVDIETGRIGSVEALIRWRSPSRGVVSPGVFLPIAEETGLITGIGDWAVREACLRLCEFWEAGATWVRMAVNVAERQLRMDHIYDVVKDVIPRYDIPPASLELEMTENIVFRNSERSADLLQRLKDLGVRVAVDDFGAGYSTLYHLANFPLDVLKIDKRFADDVLTDSRDAAVLKGIGKIAADLRLDVVAEGVETLEQVAEYKALGFRYIQGYVYSKPIELEECVQLILSAEQTHRAARER